MVCKSTDGPEVLQKIRHVSSKKKIPPLNSSGVERKGARRSRFSLGGKVGGQSF